ncbi:MAG: NADH-quinone oxidoreductase subunit NuoE [Dehalococcoidales bacterium]|nr:NADH-quinone oxidoreductase subunit NuoE [Dehalococcoidales bacterium]
MSPKELKAKAKQALQKHQHDKSLLVDILQDIQAEVGYLPKEVLQETSEGLGIPLSRVYSVATFFKAFSLTPRGRHLINVCMGTACHVRGAVKVLEKIEQELKVKRGETTKDLKFTLETVNCVGACALGPMVIIGEDYHGEMTPEAVGSVLENYN